MRGDRNDAVPTGCLRAGSWLMVIITAILYGGACLIYGR
jgi:hypothetical protein